MEKIGRYELDTLTENDILTVYLTGHGDYGENSFNDYGGWLADESKYSDSALVQQLLTLNIGILHLIVQRNIAYSFTNDDNTHNNGSDHYNNILTKDPPFYAVLSADDIDDDAVENYQIDRYTDRWAFAVNGGDMVSCDLNGDGYISMYEAHSYAISDNSTDPSYIPYQDSKPTCLKHDLSITGTLPSNPCIQTDLYIKDNSQQMIGVKNT